MPHRKLAALLEEWRAAVARYDLADPTDPTDQEMLRVEVERMRLAYHDALEELDVIARQLAGSSPAAAGDRPGAARDRVERA